MTFSEEVRAAEIQHSDVNVMILTHRIILEDPFDLYP
jgi:hypothetical protein